MLVRHTVHVLGLHGLAYATRGPLELSVASQHNPRQHCSCGNDVQRSSGVRVHHRGNHEQSDVANVPRDCHSIPIRELPPDCHRIPIREFPSERIVADQGHGRSTAGLDTRNVQVSSSRAVLSLDCHKLKDPTGPDCCQASPGEDLICDTTPIAAVLWQSACDLPAPSPATVGDRPLRPCCAGDALWEGGSALLLSLCLRQGHEHVGEVRTRLCW